MLTLQGHEGPVAALLFSPDGETLASVGKDGTLRRWSAWGDLLSTEEFNRAECIAFSDDGKVLGVGGDGIVQAINARSNNPINTSDVCAAPITGIAFVPDKNRIAYACGQKRAEVGLAGSIGFWDCRTRALIPLPVDVVPTIAVKSMVYHSGHRLLAWVTANNLLTVWPITRSSVTRFPLKRPCRSIAFSPDGKLLAAAIDWKVQLFDIERKQERSVIEGHKGMVSGLAFSPDGRHLLTGSWDKTVRVWDLTSGRERASYSWPVGRVGAVAYASDGLRAAAAGDEGPIVVWDVEE